MSTKVFCKTVAAIDIGTTKICVLIGLIDANGVLEVLGIGHAPSYGMKKGIVVNISLTVDAIKRAVDQAETMAGMKIESAVVGISGGHICSYNSAGVVAIRKGGVTQYDIDRVIDAAKAISIAPDQKILHIIPRYFRIDNQEYVQDSLGMYGVRLEGFVHIITGNISSAQNIIRSCEQAQIHVTDIVLEQIASADAVLTQSERELGVGIFDVGGGTSDFAVYKDGRICYSKVLPVAGNHFTNDLAIGAGIPIDEAERLKRSHGFVKADVGVISEKIEALLGYDDSSKKIETTTIYNVLRPRAEEILEWIGDEIKENRLRPLMPSGLVLTGGGVLLKGMGQLAEEVLDMQVRIGSPSAYFEFGNGGMVPEELKSPIYSTGYGLLVCAAKGRAHEISVNKPQVRKVWRVLSRMKSWLYDYK